MYKVSRKVGYARLPYFLIAVSQATDKSAMWRDPGISRIRPWSIALLVMALLAVAQTRRRHGEQTTSVR